MADDTTAVLSDSITATRAHVEVAAAAVLEIDDAALLRPREWRGGMQTLRHGVYRLHEVLEETQAELAADAIWTPAGALAARCTAACWALHGTVLPYADLIDAPAQGEWTMRQVLSHVISSEDFWHWLSGHWVEKLHAGVEIPPRGYVREEVPDKYRAEEAVLDEPFESLRRQLDEHLDASIDNLMEVERLGALDAPVTWNRAAVTIRFYPVRWSAHLREHTLQLEQTVVLAGREPREVERILRPILAAYGELEGTARLVPEAAAAPILEAAGLGIAHHAREIADAAAASEAGS